MAAVVRLKVLLKLLGREPTDVQLTVLRTELAGGVVSLTSAAEPSC